MARLLSVNVGLPREITWNGKTVRTAIWKSPVEGRRLVRKLNIDGDAQAGLAGHGGSSAPYLSTKWIHTDTGSTSLGAVILLSASLERISLLRGLLMPRFACIGDRYRIGGAVFEVTQPRVTCYRVGIRMNEPRMPALLVAQRRPGFYCRVLQEGEVGAGDDIAKVADGPERMMVAEIDALLYLPARHASASGTSAPHTGTEQRLAIFLSSNTQVSESDRDQLATVGRREPITFASPSRENRMGSEVRSCAIRFEKVMYWMSAHHGESLPRCGSDSAGVGATPVMSMLHALAAESSQRQVCWIYGARDRANHPFAEESRSLNHCS
jgi:MOSC domain-containing protein YiiM